MAKLTARQEAFVREYLLDGNATAAMRRMGFQGKRPQQCGWWLLQNKDVQEAVAEGRKRLAEEAGRRALDVLHDIQAVAREAREGGDLRTALRGLELEGKHYGMFTDRVRQEISGPGGGPVPTEIVVSFVDPDGQGTSYQGEEAEADNDGPAEADGISPEERGADEEGPEDTEEMGAEGRAKVCPVPEAAGPASGSRRLRRENAPFSWENDVFAGENSSFSKAFSKPFSQPEERPLQKGLPAVHPGQGTALDERSPRPEGGSSPQEDDFSLRKGDPRQTEDAFSPKEQGASPREGAFCFREGGSSQREDGSSQHEGDACHGEGEYSPKEDVSCQHGGGPAEGRFSPAERRSSPQEGRA